MEMEQSFVKNQGGFTLIELLTVIAIIGVLSTVALTSLTAARNRARDAKRHAEIEQIQKALELYYLDHGEYPLSGGSTASFQNTGWTNSGNASWDALAASLAPYMATLPVDPVNDVTLFRRTYNYYSRAYGCEKQWYMLAYGLEGSTADGRGITTCDGMLFDYVNAITVGECKGCR